MANAANHEATRFFIDGLWTAPADPQYREVLEAATEERIGTVALGSPADIDSAVQAASTAFTDGPWSRTTREERATVLDRFADALDRRSESTARLVSQENGMPMSLSRGYNGAAPVALLKMYAQQIRENSDEERRPSATGGTLVRQEPVGVVGAIIPWNYPQTLAMTKIAPALAAGCTVVVKPSPETSLDAYVFAEAAEEAGLPAGVLNVVAADREASASLVTHPLVDKIAFTGSTQAGRWIAAECGRLIRRVTLELGGKSASVFLEDGELNGFLANLADASFKNNAQTCTTQSRILVARSRYDEVVDAVGAFADQMRVGNPLDDDTEIGPMVSAAHRRKVLDYIDIGLSSDARLIAGGKSPVAGQPRGWYVQPTVFADVDNSDRLAREEIFGPVMAIIPFDDDDDAIRIANDSEYGLAGSVWSADEEHGVALARRVRTGTIGVNGYKVDLGSPFGGMKNSGIGREMGPEALANYIELKSIYTV